VDIAANEASTMSAVLDGCTEKQLLTHLAGLMPSWNIEWIQRGARHCRRRQLRDSASPHLPIQYITNQIPAAARWATFLSIPR